MEKDKKIKAEKVKNKKRKKKQKSQLVKLIKVYCVNLSFSIFIYCLSYKIFQIFEYNVIFNC